MTFLWIQPSNAAHVVSLDEADRILMHGGLTLEKRLAAYARLQRCRVGEWVRVTDGGAYGVGTFIRLGPEVR